MQVGQLQARLNTEHRLWGTDRLVLFNSDRALNRDEMLKDIFATMAEPFRIQAVAWVRGREGSCLLPLTGSCLCGLLQHEARWELNYS